MKARAIVAAVLLCAVALCLDELPPERKALDLDGSTLDGALKEYDVLFVLFYSPWCGHSDEALRKFRLAATLTNSSRVAFATVDVVENKALAERFALPAYPFLKLFRNHSASNALDFDGDNDIFDYFYFAVHDGLRELPLVEQFGRLPGLAHPFVVAFCLPYNKTEATDAAEKQLLEQSFRKDLSHFYFVKANCPPTFESVIDVQRMAIFDPLRNYLNATNRLWLLNQDVLVAMKQESRDLFADEFIRRSEEPTQIIDIDELVIVVFRPPGVLAFPFYHRTPIITLNFRDLYEPAIQHLINTELKPSVSLVFNNRMRKYLIENNLIGSFLLYREKISDELYLRATYYNATLKLDPENPDFYHGNDKAIASRMFYFITDVNTNVTRRLLYFLGKSEADLPVLAGVFWDKKERKMYKKTRGAPAANYVLDIHLFELAQEVFNKQSELTSEIDRESDQSKSRMPSKVHEISAYALERIIYSTSIRRCIVVEFYTSYCVHSKKLRPLFDKLSLGLSTDRLHFARIHLIHEEVRYFRIKHVPVVRFYYPGYNNEFLELNLQTYSEAEIKKFITEAYKEDRCLGDLNQRADREKPEL